MAEESKRSPSSSLEIEINTNEIIDDNGDEHHEEFQSAPISNKIQNSGEYQVEIPLDLDDHDADIATVELEAEILRESHSKGSLLLDEEENKKEQEIKVDLSPKDQEFLGLIEEKPVQKREKRRNKGKARKRPPPIDFIAAQEIIRLPRLGTKFFSEGYFTTDIPEELADILSPEEYRESIGKINECLKRIPSLRIGLVWLIPTILLSATLFFIILFVRSPPFLLISVLFGLCCTFGLAAAIGIAVYYIFQREYIVQVAKEDVKLYHKGVRLARQNTDNKALFIVIEPGEDRDD